MSSVPPNPLPSVRRIVTTHDASGKSTVQSDSDMLTKESGLSGLRIGRIWITSDGIPTNDNNTDEDGGQRTMDNPVVPQDGTNIQTVELAPGASIPMHRTSSLDHNILLSGELIAITEDGEEKHLKNPGDTVIQKGTLHGWRNPSKEHWARWIVVVVAAKPAVVNGVTFEPAFR